MPTTVLSDPRDFKVRRIVPRDLAAIVAIDAGVSGRSRRSYFERRLAAAQAQPDLHVQFAADDGEQIAGYAFARKLIGEFGHAEPALRLEVVGVPPAMQGQGIGTQLLDALEADARASHIGALRTTASWREDGMLRFLNHAGFDLGPTQMLECSVHSGRLGAEQATEASEQFSAEIRYGGNQTTDFEPLARDRADVRILARHDEADICKIDRRITGRNRRAYIERLVDEALNDSAVRVSLTARVDGVVAGFVMARTDFGDFGRTEPVAVLDTIGVDPDFTHRGVGTALLSQLFANLQGLRVESVETTLARQDFGLLGFLYAAGFGASQRLEFCKQLS